MADAAAVRAAAWVVVGCEDAELEVEVVEAEILVGGPAGWLAAWGRGFGGGVCGC